MDDAEATEAWLDSRPLYEQAFYIYAGALAIGILVMLVQKAIEDDQGQNEN